MEIFFLGSATFCNMLRHISYARIFKGTFFTIEKDTTKSLRLRGIRVLDATSRREETKANGATKWRQISKTCKNHLKNRFWSESKFFSGNVIALCLDSDERISKIVMTTLNLKKSKKNNFAGGSRV